MSQRSVSAGARLRAAIEVERPLQVVGTINAYAALLAQNAGFRAIYLSGAGVANASFGLPDLGITSLNDVCEDVRRITAACPLPLLVDADTGFGSAFNIARTCRELIRAGAAGMHLEDQVSAKRCGHRPGKALVSAAEMVDRLKAAVDARSDGEFVNRQFAAGIKVPVLANITEFGQTPLFSTAELGSAGVRLVLYPLSAFRAAAKAQVVVYDAIRRQGTQQSVVPYMQTREELYGVLGYHAYEQKLDELFGKASDD